MIYVNIDTLAAKRILSIVTESKWLSCYLSKLCFILTWANIDTIHITRILSNVVEKKRISSFLHYMYMLIYTDIETLLSQRTPSIVFKTKYSPQHSSNKAKDASQNNLLLHCIIVDCLRLFNAIGNGTVEISDKASCCKNKRGSKLQETLLCFRRSSLLFLYFISLQQQAACNKISPASQPAQ